MFRKIVVMRDNGRYFKIYGVYRGQDLPRSETSVGRASSWFHRRLLTALSWPVRFVPRRFVQSDVSYQVFRTKLQAVCQNVRRSVTTTLFLKIGILSSGTKCSKYKTSKGTKRLRTKRTGHETSKDRSTRDKTDVHGWSLTQSPGADHFPLSPISSKWILAVHLSVSIQWI